MSLIKTIYNGTRISSLLIQLPTQGDASIQQVEPSLRRTHLSTTPVLKLHSKEMYQAASDHAHQVKSRLTEFYYILQKYISDCHQVVSI